MLQNDNLVLTLLKSVSNTIAEVYEFNILSLYFPLRFDNYYSVLYANVCRWLLNEVFMVFFEQEVEKPNEWGNNDNEKYHKMSKVADKIDVKYTEINRTNS